MHDFSFGFIQKIGEGISSTLHKQKVAREGTIGTTKAGYEMSSMPFRPAPLHYSTASRQKKLPHEANKRQ